MAAEERIPDRPGPDDPLILYVHVPKTAGSTVNALLARMYGEGRAHCEGVIARPADLGPLCGRMNWLSGHVPVDAFRSTVRRETARPLRLFTAIREPGAQIASHYNWLIEIFHRGEAFYNGHPEPIRRISETIRASDNSDPARVIANLDSYQGLFLNQQSHYVLGQRAGWGAGGVVQRLREYEHVATEDQLGDLVERMTGKRVEIDVTENASRYHFDPDVFQAPELRRFLAERHFYDFALYDGVRRLNDAS